jgi:hypothetical protein
MEAVIKEDKEKIEAALVQKEAVLEADADDVFRIREAQLKERERR